LLDLSRVCRIAANSCISAEPLFLIFQKIYSGCCMVAAQAGDDHRAASVLVSRETRDMGFDASVLPKCISQVGLTRRHIFVRLCNMWWRSSKAEIRLARDPTPGPHNMHKVACGFRRILLLA
jgi:hypothetical protein